MLPTEIATALGERADGAHHARLRSGIGAPTGESHLVVADGVLRVFARSSLLDPLTELTGVSLARVERSPLRTELAIEHASGLATVSLGYGEPEIVEDLLAHLAPSPSPSPSPSRAALLDLLQARLTALEHATASGPFAALLAVDQPRAARRALFAAREALARGNRDAAIAALADASRRAHWPPRVALAEVLFEAERYPEALGALRRADDAHAPDDVIVPLLERASRAAEDESELVRALERKRRTVRDRAARRAVEDELRELRERRARNKASERPPQSNRAPGARKQPTAAEPAPLPPARKQQAAKPARRRAAGQTSAVVERVVAETERALPPAAPPQPSRLPWVVLITLLVIGFGAALRRLLMAP